MHTHLLHVLCLLVHGAMRNVWLNDEQLQVPLISDSNDQKQILSQFPQIHERWKKFLKSPSTKENFIHLLEATSHHFRKSFKVTKPGLRKKGYRDLSMVDQEAARKAVAKYEKFETIEDFRQSAKELAGSRDFGAQLF